MKRHFIAGLSIFTVAGVVSWKLASHPEASVGLQDVSVIQGSEHTHPGPTNELAGIRIRLSPSDFGLEITAPASAVPQITLASE
jgi:hypothetical protein